MCTTLNYKSEIPNNRILYSISLIISHKRFSESQQIAVFLLIDQQMVFLTHILNLPQFFPPQMNCFVTLLSPFP